MGSFDGVRLAERGDGIVNAEELFHLAGGWSDEWGLDGDARLTVSGVNGGWVDSSVNEQMRGFINEQGHVVLADKSPDLLARHLNCARLGIGRIKIIPSTLCS